MINDVLRTGRGGEQAFERHRRSRQRVGLAARGNQGAARQTKKVVKSQVSRRDKQAGRLEEQLNKRGASAQILRTPTHRLPWPNKPRRPAERYRQERFQGGGQGGLSTNGCVILGGRVLP